MNLLNHGTRKSISIVGANGHLNQLGRVRLTSDLFCGHYRPGQRAAKLHQVKAPLVEADLTKAEIREFSRQAGLPTWDRPAAACLSSRIPYGTPVTIQNIKTVVPTDLKLAWIKAEVAAGVAPGPHAVIGPGCRVGEGALVRDSVLLSGCAVGPGAQVSGSILAEGAEVEAGARLENAVIGRDERVSA